MATMSFDQEESRKVIPFFSRLLIVIALLVFCYSFASKFVLTNLPGFPFYTYIVCYALLILLLQPTKFPPLLLIIVLLNFGSATFRGIFFSHFETTFWSVIFALMFILSNLVSIIIFLNFFTRRLVLPVPSEEVTKRGSKSLLSLFFSIALYVCLISPFYLGVIKPGPYRGSIEPEPYKIDHVYKEVLTVAKEPDREIGRRYFLDGREAASMGTKFGYIKSIEYYNKCLELIPGFSTAYAEMAYSKASLGRISKMIDTSDNVAEMYFADAVIAIGKAKEKNPNNPTVFGVEALLDFFAGKDDSARSTIAYAETLAQKGGYGDRVVQAKAMLEKNNIEKARYLLGIKQITPDNAELLNLLGLAYYQIGNSDSARLNLERATRLSPNYAEAYINLALVDTDNYEAYYGKASEKDTEFKRTISYYSTVWTTQKLLRYYYLILLIWFVVRFASYISKGVDLSTKTLNPKYLKRIRATFRSCVLIFVCSYGIFEFYIHIHNPINTISHMFPIKFPFF
jgi:tetratricopeptide (TPR) repeat protein